MFSSHPHRTLRMDMWCVRVMSEPLVPLASDFPWNQEDTRHSTEDIVRSSRGSQQITAWHVHLRREVAGLQEQCLSPVAIFGRGVRISSGATAHLRSGGGHGDRTAGVDFRPDGRSGIRTRLLMCAPQPTHRLRTGLMAAVLPTWAAVSPGLNRDGRRHNSTFRSGGRRESGSRAESRSTLTDCEELVRMSRKRPASGEVDATVHLGDARSCGFRKGRKAFKLARKLAEMREVRPCPDSYPEARRVRAQLGERRQLQGGSAPFA